MYEIGDPEIDAIAKLIKNGSLFRYTDPQSSQAKAFEHSWSSLIGVEHTIAVNSGTSALISGLVGLGVGPGDEVIVPAYTFIATPIAVLATGAIPVIVDINESLTLDPLELKRVITNRTKAIIPVHMCGAPCDMDAIMKLASENNLLVIEDACQSAGGTYRGMHLGSIGDIGCFSFNYFKIISCGEGGALVTSNQTYYERAMVYHDSGCAIFGSNANAIHIPSFAGQNYRISEIQGAILNEQLKRLNSILQRLRHVKHTLIRELDDNNGLKIIKSNDMEGDCSTKLGLIFNSPNQASLFSKKLAAQAIRTNIPINERQHIYCNWEPVLSKRGAFHPGTNPFLRAENSTIDAIYSKDMCPRTLEILRNTVLIDIFPSWGLEEVEKIVNVVHE